MSSPKPKLVFEVLIDDSFANVCAGVALDPISNKRVLSLINDFEDGQWRYGKFASFIWDNIAETALSYKERQNLIDSSHSSLIKAAKNLRLTDDLPNPPKKDVGRGSEIAEIILYGIMKHHYNALSVVPKIFYKQNVNDYAKGADSVHIVINESEGDFSLWFGEAKFYSDISDFRLDTVVESVEESLKTEKLKKENSIVTSITDIDEVVTNGVLRTSIKNALSTDNSLDILKSRIHIPILLLHECKITKDQKFLDTPYKDSLRKEHLSKAEKYFDKQIAKCKLSIVKYSEINFHIILLPVPSKKNVVDYFVDQAKMYRKKLGS